jgi:hypothetical protein
MDDDKLKEVFGEHDTDADGELSKDEFGNAIFSILKANKDEAADENEGDDDENE